MSEYVVVIATIDGSGRIGWVGEHVTLVGYSLRFSTFGNVFCLRSWSDGGGASIGCVVSGPGPAENVRQHT